MPHAAFGQPKVSPTLNVRRNASQRHDLTRQASDIALADAVAQAVRAVPSVVDLSSGLSVPAATYGPGRHVAGIVVHHPTVETYSVEVHVVLSEAYCTRASAATAVRGERDPEACGPITEVADLIRRAVRRSIQEMTSLALERIDVFIDDLR